MSIKEDIDKTIDMVENNNLMFPDCNTFEVSPRFEKYSKVYQFSNENIKKYYKKFDYSKKVLTVASSGDNLLHSLLMGAKDIVMFDINKLTDYYINLKIGAIKSLNLEEFKEYFGNNKLNYPILKKELFDKIKKELPTKYNEYWNNIYEMYDMEKGNFQYGFFYQQFDKSKNYENLDYLNNDSYEQLIKILNSNINIKFINKDLLLIDDLDLDGEYSSMFLSNIIDYIDEHDYFKEFIENRLAPKLIDNGKIMYNYTWLNDDPTYFKSKNYSMYKIRNTDEKIYVYTKK